MPIADAITKTSICIDTTPVYNVIMLNDDVTSFEFVIGVLTDIFNHSHHEAELVASVIHENGRAIVGTYNLEIAQQKVSEVAVAARAEGYPLKTIIETA